MPSRSHRPRRSATAPAVLAAAAALLLGPIAPGFATPGRAAVPLTASSKIEASDLTSVAVVPHSSNSFLLGDETGTVDNGSVVLHRHHGRWTTTPVNVPNDTTLNGIAAGSASTAWIVGYYYNTKAEQRIFLGRFAGGSLKRVTIKGATLGGLQAVAASSASNVWVVGETTTATSITTLAARWNGKTWKQTKVPDTVAQGPITPYAVATTGPDNTWMTGTTGGNQSVIMHWNGTTWTQTFLGGPELASINGIAASGSHAWAVGDTRTKHATGFVDRALVMRWTGSAWSSVTAPSPGGDDVLSGVAAVGSHGFGVGYYVSGKSNYHPLLVLLSGHSATQQTVAPVRHHDPVLVAAAASTKLTVAVGSYDGREDDPPSGAFAETYRHHLWSRWPLPT
jgi:hypothetical protein